MRVNVQRRFRAAMLICFHAPSPLVYFGLFRINTMAHTLGMSIQQHQQKSLLKFYVLPRAKKEPLSRKILGKAVQNAVGKGTGPSNLPKPILASFVTPLKMGAKKPGSSSDSLYRDTSCHPFSEGAALSAPSFWFLHVMPGIE